MGNDYCQPCKGMTVLLKEDVHFIISMTTYYILVLSVLMSFNFNLKARCIMCSGVGEITRDKAIELAKKRNEN